MNENITGQPDYPSYQPPVDQLLMLGEAEDVRHDEWPDYLAMGIGPQHIPELFRMANDEELNEIINVNVERPEDWASIHAVRAIGQLRDPSTVDQLVELLTTQHDHEWLQEELPEIFAMIGPAAIPALTAYLADPSHGVYERAYASNGLVAIAKAYPESRDEVVRIISDQLEKFDENDDEFNAFIIGDLGELKATETLPLIDRVFEADKVDTFVIGKDDVLIDMGLKERPPMPSLEELFATLPQPPEDFESEPAFIPGPLPPAPRRTLTSTTPPIKFNAKRVGGKKKSKHKKKR
jgi:hypothetical protein